MFEDAAPHAYACVQVDKVANANTRAEWEVIPTNAVSVRARNINPLLFSKGRNISCHSALLQRQLYGWLAGRQVVFVYCSNSNDAARSMMVMITGTMPGQQYHACTTARCSRGGG